MTHTTPMQAAVIHAMPHKHEANTADVTHNVREALKQRARSPFVGIACGRKTIMIRRELFKKSLAGLTVVSAELVTETKREWGKSSLGYALRVHAVGDRVKATRLFLHQDPREYSNRQIIFAWQKTQAKAAEKKAALATLPKPQDRKQTARLRKITTLWAKLQKLSRRPKNPAVQAGWEMPMNNRYGIYNWYQQKRLRRKFNGKSELYRAAFADANRELATKKPWEIDILKRETVYGSERYGYLLNSDDRKAVKAQLAVLFGVPEVAISAFRKLETYLIKDGQQ